MADRFKVFQSRCWPHISHQHLWYHILTPRYYFPSIFFLFYLIYRSKYRLRHFCIIYFHLECLYLHVSRKRWNSRLLILCNMAYYMVYIIYKIINFWKMLLPGVRCRRFGNVFLIIENRLIINRSFMFFNFNIVCYCIPTFSINYCFTQSTEKYRLIAWKLVLTKF